MSKINFLKTKEKQERDDVNNQNKDDNQHQNIAWSSPGENKAEKKDIKKSNFFGLLNKVKLDKNKNSFNDIKSSRKKVLQSIKEENQQTTDNPKDKSKIFFRDFFRKINFKDNLFNYQNLFYKEKNNRKSYKKINDKIKKTEETKDVSAEEKNIKKVESEKINSPVEVNDSSANMKKNILSDDDNDKKIKKDDQLNEEWSNPDVLDSNLIKEEIISFFDWKRKIIIFFSSIVVPCLLLGVIYSGLNYYGNKQEIKGETIYNKSLDLDQKINQKKEGLIEILSFQKRLKVVAVLLNEHIYWNNFFDFLEKHVIDDVYFVNFSGDINGEYGIEAIGKEYKNIVEQVEAFRIDTLIEKAEVKEGRITEGKDSDGVKFNLNLIINPEILKKID